MVFDGVSNLAVLFQAGTAAHRPLANLDLAIIGVYFLLVFGIGFYFSRRERTSEEYFLAGRNIVWFFIGASLFVSNISTEHFIGLSGTGASSGLAVGHFEWLACLILLILGWVFVPFYLRSNVFTMPQFLERRFNRQCAVYLAGISIIAYIFTKISVQLYAAIFRAPFQSSIRGLSGRNFDHRVHLHQNFGAALCRERSSRTCSRLVVV